MIRILSSKGPRFPEVLTPSTQRKDCGYTPPLSWQNTVRVPYILSATWHTDLLLSPWRHSRNAGEANYIFRHPDKAGQNSPVMH